MFKMHKAKNEINEGIDNSIMVRDFSKQLSIMDKITR